MLACADMCVYTCYSTQLTITDSLYWNKPHALAKPPACFASCGFAGDGAAANGVPKGVDVHEATAVLVSAAALSFCFSFRFSFKTSSCEA